MRVCEGGRASALADLLATRRYARRPACHLHSRGSRQPCRTLGHRSRALGRDAQAGSVVGRRCVSAQTSFDTIGSGRLSVGGRCSSYNVRSGDWTARDEASIAGKLQVAKKPTPTKTTSARRDRRAKAVTAPAQPITMSAAAGSARGAGRNVPATTPASTRSAGRAAGKDTPLGHARRGTLSRKAGNQEPGARIRG